MTRTSGTKMCRNAQGWFSDEYDELNEDVRIIAVPQLDSYRSCLMCKVRVEPSNPPLGQCLHIAILSFVYAIDIAKKLRRSQIFDIAKKLRRSQIFNAFSRYIYSKYFELNVKFDDVIHWILDGWNVSRSLWLLAQFLKWCWCIAWCFCLWIWRCCTKR